jgi:hypothetical protein
MDSLDETPVTQTRYAMRLVKGRKNIMQMT